MSAPEERWITATAANSSPVERERDAQIERAIVRDGRPLAEIGVIATLRPGRCWQVEILPRHELLERCDARGRHPSTEPEAARICKHMAAWIRGLAPAVCPEIFVWVHDDGKASYQRGTIERAPRRGQPPRALAPRRVRP